MEQPRSIVMMTPGELSQYQMNIGRLNDSRYLLFLKITESLEKRNQLQTKK